MARQLQMMHPPQGTAAQVGMAGVSLIFCAFALLMCASHARKWRRRWNACLDYGYEYEDYEDPVIELNPEATVVTTLQRAIATATESETEMDDIFLSTEQQAAVWQKNILMGGKCQLPDFSGVILYNADGNVQRANATATKPESEIDDMFLSREQQAAVWQKNILMGGKCQLPDFSGVILYDADGNTVTPARTPRPLLTWK